MAFFEGQMDPNLQWTQIETHLPQKDSWIFQQ